MMATPPQEGERLALPGLPEDYYCCLEPNSNPMDRLAGLKVLGDRRNTASLGLFVVLFFALILTLLAIGEAVRLAQPAASPLLNPAMTLALVLLLLFPVVLAAMLGISLGQAIRQPKARINPELERVWLLQRGGHRIGRLRLLPEGLRQQLLWVSLEPKYRGQGIGQTFVTTVLKAEGCPCRAKVNPERNAAAKLFLQRCGFQLPPALQGESRPGPQSLWEPRSVWLFHSPTE